MTRSIPLHRDGKEIPMATASTRRRPIEPEPIGRSETVADLLGRLGGIPASRVRLHPTPGTATERDLIEVNGRKQGLCELVEGTLVEKPMGFEESVLAALLIFYLGNFVVHRKLGILTGEGGMMRLFTGLVRIPDVAFIARTSFPNGKRPKGPVPAIAPDLAIEVLSKGNSKAEIAKKLREYFESGTRLVWLVDPKTRSVRVHTSPSDSTRLDADSTLDGGAVLPGFRLPLADLFPLAD
jgi:Uma2 family endonuclease